MFGEMTMPTQFRYQEVLQRGRPRHDRWDAFSLRHPPMPPAHWAKIFSPFDALRGFGEALSAREVAYTAQPVPEEEDAALLEEQLRRLRELTRNRHLARANRVQVTAEVYRPCRDPHSLAFGLLGRVETLRGTVWGVDTEVSRTLRLENENIPLDALVSLRIQED